MVKTVGSANHNPCSLTILSKFPNVMSQLVLLVTYMMYSSESPDVKFSNMKGAGA